VDGTGQTLGLFELSGYTAADISGYESYYHLPAVPLQNVLVHGFPGNPGSGADEVTLDIELMIALAPGASKIVVYEGPNTSLGVVDTYDRIAADNLAKQISTSWGLSETSTSLRVLESENSAFQEMAAQGQSIYAASGDRGAYDNGSSLSVDDPASQPYMVGTGGTQLFVNPDETYNHETTWNVNGTVSGGAGGGGVSVVWSIPSWQQGIGSAASSTMRNVPDVSLNSDQYTGYSIFYGNRWWIYGGTSCAAPLWAAFTALANEQRATNGQGLLGFANPTLYQLAQEANYASDFHDITAGTNLYYHAVTGYDNATGWGSFVGSSLLADLAPVSGPPTKPLPPTNLTATAGDATVTLNWTPSSGATNYSVYRGTSSGGEGAIPLATGITATTHSDNTVTNGTTYYYTVTASNSAGESGSSNEAFATPTAASVLSITAGPTAIPGSTNATIQWTTNLASTSAVRYGKSPSHLTRAATNSAPVTEHAVNLTGLTGRTTYYYQVSSKTGSMRVFSAVLSFTTTG
jgi:subtilase family serine protease